MRGARWVRHAGHGLCLGHGLCRGHEGVGPQARTGANGERIPVPGGGDAPGVPPASIGIRASTPCGASTQGRLERRLGGPGLGCPEDPGGPGPTVFDGEEAGEATPAR